MGNGDMDKDQILLEKEAEFYRMQEMSTPMKGQL